MGDDEINECVYRLLRAFLFSSAFLLSRGLLKHSFSTYIFQDY